MLEHGLPTPILGFELTGDPLLEGEFLPLRQGLTVLYGLNGAGKTRLIRGVRAALLGVRDDIEIGMIVRAEPSSSTEQ
ncbi:ATP-binding protein [Microbacterium sp.]|uniref:ATP-binding protein n=1 Tax=Microbacterium sp. TaxID=51671 RepID=UPI002810A0EE|nr:ATP-binding protein [Microbacterium sp.]